MENNDDFVKSMAICLSIIMFLLIIQVLFMPRFVYIEFFLCYFTPLTTCFRFRTLVSYIFSFALLITPVLIIIFAIYYKKKFNLKYQVYNQKQKTVMPNVLPPEHVLTNNFLTNSNTLLKCTINNQTYSNGYNLYRKHRQLTRKKYALFVTKFIFKVFVIALIFATYFINFVS